MSTTIERKFKDFFMPFQLLNVELVRLWQDWQIARERINQEDRSNYWLCLSQLLNLWKGLLAVLVLVKYPKKMVVNLPCELLEKIPH